MSDSSLDRDPFEMVAESFLARYRAGERPSIAEYAARHPELAERIRRLLPALVVVERDLSVGGDASPSGRDADGVPSRHLGDYRILREVGRGGMGVVYEAEQVSLGRRVALKVLPGHVAGNRKALERFRREAKAAARLHHTNIVPVFEVGCEGDVAFYAMQFIQGQGLDQVIDELGRLRPRDGKSAETDHAAAGRPAESADGIDAAGVTAAGLRGPTLSQVAVSLLIGRLGTEGLRTATGVDGEVTEAEALDPAATSVAGAWATSQPLVAPAPTAGLSTSAVLPGGTAVSSADSSGSRQPFFRSVARIGRQAAQGLAHAHSRGVVHRDIKPSNLLLDTAGVVWITDFGLAKAEDDGLTATGDILGTLRYMAPERFRGEGDARADIYALGLTLYELLTLCPAYAVNDRLELIERVKNEEPPRPRSLDARIPRDLETIVLKAIDKDPARRYATAEALAEDLRRFLDDEPIQARRASTNERFARWARHHPTIAVVGAVLAAVLILSTIVSLSVAGRMSELAAKESRAAIAERNASKAAVAETYRAMLSEAKALRAGHEPGWREEALANLARLATMPTARRDLAELRTEAAAALGQPDIRLTSRVELPAQELGSFTFIRDERTLVTTSRAAGLDFWDLKEGRHLASARGLAVAESTLDKALSPLPDGRGLIVGTADRGVVFTDMHGQPLPRATIARGSSRPTKLAIDAGGRRVAVAWSDGAGIAIHDVASGALLKRFPGTRFALSPDGLWLACEEDSEIVLLPIDPAGVRVVLGHHGGANALAFSPDGSLLATAFGDHTTVLWDIARREPFGTLRGHRERVLDVAFSPDGEWIATASLDYTTRIWETRTGQVFATLPGADAVRRVEWSPAGDLLATSTDTGREVNIYSITGRRRVQRWLSGHRCELHNVAADPRRDRLMTSGYQELNSWDLSGTATASVSLEPHPGAVTAMTFSRDGSLLATASWLGPGYREILIRDGETGAVRSRIPGLQIVRALAFDRTGQRLAFCGDAGTVVVWDLEVSRPVREFSTGSPAYAVAYLDREQGLVTHDSHSAILFDIDSGRRKQSVDLAHGRIRAMLVDRTRDRLVVGFEDGTIGGLTLPELIPGPRLEGAHLGSVECLSLSPDGRLLATAGADRRIALRDASSFETLLYLPTWAGNIRDLTFNFSGRRLAVVGTDIDLDLWDLAELSQGLTAVHLAWGRPDPAPVPMAGPADVRSRPTIAVIRRPGAADPVALQRAQLLIQSGVGAFAGGRWADAVRDLQKARDQLRTLHEAAREDRQVASQLGVSLTFLSNALRNEQGLAVAQASFREAREVFEAIREPSSVDLYNLACVYARLSDPVGPGDASLDAAEREDLAGRAIGSLRRSLSAGMSDFALMDRDPDLDPVRNRPDFRSLVLDRGFPSDPFAGPSPLSRPEMDDPSARAELIGLSADIAQRPSEFDSYWNRGQFFARHREWPRALADFREALRLHPPESWADQDRDTWFAFTAGLVSLQADDLEGYRRIARAMLDRFAGSANSSTRDRTAKINLFANPPPGDLKKIVDLADRSVRLGQDSPGLCWLQLTRGMASYRAGDLASSAKWLRQAEGSGLDDLSRAVAQFYLAMAEYRLGHSERARALLQQASQMLDAATGPRDWGVRWFSVVETVLSRREAEALILRTPVESAGRDSRDAR